MLELKFKRFGRKCLLGLHSVRWEMRHFSSVATRPSTNITASMRPQHPSTLKQDSRVKSQESRFKIRNFAIYLSSLLKTQAGWLADCPTVGCALGRRALASLPWLRRASQSQRAAGGASRHSQQLSVARVPRHGPPRA